VQDVAYRGEIKPIRNGRLLIVRCLRCGGDTALVKDAKRPHSMSREDARRHVTDDRAAPISSHNEAEAVSGLIAALAAEGTAWMETERAISVHVSHELRCRTAEYEACGRSSECVYDEGKRESRQGLSPQGAAASSVGEVHMGWTKKDFDQGKCLVDKRRGSTQCRSTNPQREKSLGQLR
jgi:hypothetical protein